MTTKPATPRTDGEPLVIDYAPNIPGVPLHQINKAWTTISAGYINQPVRPLVAEGLIPYAPYIVTACNAYPRLAEENARLREALEKLVTCAEWNADLTATPEWGEHTLAAIDQARAALKQEG